MPFLIGTDEAGYGPNLGPLTITGSLWEVEDLEVDLYQTLDQVVVQKAPRKLKRNSGNHDESSRKIFIADSKKVYSPSGSIANLETSVLALLHNLTGRIPSNWHELVELVCPGVSNDALVGQTWLAGRSLELPLAADAAQIESASKRFDTICQHANVRLLQFHCMPVFAPRFNSLVDQLGNKATLLSTETLKIVRTLLDAADDDVEVGCDKHGGRSKYGALIQQFLTESLVTVGDETTDASDYFFRENNRDVVIRFQAKGESFLPTAFASMVSKYVREVFMELWNDFWQLKIPDLKPTKGYPVDAKRFKNDIQSVQDALGIEDRAIWRFK